MLTPENFTYWLQGFVELTETKQPSEAQWQAIKDHLQLVFTKVTPDLGKPLQGPTPPVPFPGYQPLPVDRFKPNWLVPEIGKWPPGTVIC